jgi:hypothetical protein
MKSLPHWVAVALLAAGTAVTAEANVFPAYAGLLRALGPILVALGGGTALSLPGIGPLAARFAAKKETP